MHDERMQRRRPSPIRPSAIRAVAAVTAAMLLLAACGTDEGGGGGGGGGNYTLHTLIINASTADAVVHYTGAAADDVTLPTCTAELIDFPLADPFTIEINGDTVLDSDADLPDGLPNEGQSDLIVELDVAADGTKSFDKVRPGSGLTKPSKAAYCPSLPG